MVNVPATAGTPASSQRVSYAEDLYVRADNYQPVRVELHSVLPQGAAEATTTFSQWNTGVTITPPPADQVSNP
jgi:hypothetical protein